MPQEQCVAFDRVVVSEWFGISLVTLVSIERMRITLTGERIIRV